MTKEKMKSWSPLWQQVNDSFEKILFMDEDVMIFKSEMLQMWDSNHRVVPH